MRRVLVTRARAQGERMAALVRERGGDPVLFPTIATRLVAGVGRLVVAGFDWLVLTSGTAVAYFFRVGQMAGFRGRIACVGRRTAEAVVERGYHVDLVPVLETAGGLADALVAEGVAGCDVLLPQAAIAKGVLGVRLGEAGARVVAVPLYETICPEPVAAELTAVRAGFEVATFTSPSTFEHFLRYACAPALLRVARIACIGSVTAQAVVSCGFEPALVASEARVETLVAESMACFV